MAEERCDGETRMAAAGAPSTIPTGDGSFWSDVSPLLLSACQELGDGELVHGENFNLFAAMSALEVLLVSCQVIQIGLRWINCQIISKLVVGSRLQRGGALASEVELWRARSSEAGCGKVELWRARWTFRELGCQSSEVELSPRSSVGPGTSADRTRTSVVNGLRKKLKENMDDFQDLREIINAEYKETVQRRYYTVTGENPDEKTVELLISTGESETFLQKAIQAS